MSDKNEDNKVVPFPSHKVKKPKTEGKPTLVQSIDQNRKMTLFLSLMSTLLFATFLTSRMNQPSLSQNSRDIASATPGIDRRDLDEEIVLAKKIARESLRQPASRGREPTAEDILRHGELASVYNLLFSDSGALIGLEFNGKKGEERTVEDGRAAFLLRHKELLRIDVNKAKLVESIQDNERTFEVYELRQGETLKARVHFTIDKDEYVYSMKVELI